MRDLLGPLCDLLPEALAFALRALWTSSYPAAIAALRMQASRVWRVEASWAAIAAAHEARDCIDPSDPIVPLLTLVIRDRLDAEHLRLCADQIERQQTEACPQLA